MSVVALNASELVDVAVGAVVLVSALAGNAEVAWNDVGGGFVCLMVSMQILRVLLVLSVQLLLALFIISVWLVSSPSGNTF